MTYNHPTKRHRLLSESSFTDLCQRKKEPPHSGNGLVFLHLALSCFSEANVKKRMIMKKGINHRKRENQLGLLLNTHNKFQKKKRANKLSSAGLYCPAGVLFTSARQL